MSELSVSLISGLTGVLVGLAIQLVYDYFANKKQKREDCKKDCINEWLDFRTEIKDFFVNSNERNNLYFRQSYMIKTELLKSIPNSKESKEIVQDLIDRLKRKDEKMSLKGTAEEALKINADPDKQKIFEIEMFAVIYDVIRMIQKI